MTEALEKTLPDVSHGSEGDRFFGIFRFPHGRWQTLTDRDGKPIFYGSPVAAQRAALAHLMSQLFRPITVERASDLATMREALGVDDWQRGRRKRRSVERTKKSLPGGKSVIVERRHKPKRLPEDKPC